MPRPSSKDIDPFTDVVFLEDAFFSDIAQEHRIYSVISDQQPVPCLIVAGGERDVKKWWARTCVIPNEAPCTRITDPSFGSALALIRNAHKGQVRAAREFACIDTWSSLSYRDQPFAHVSVSDLHKEIDNVIESIGKERLTVQQIGSALEFLTTQRSRQLRWSPISIVETPAKLADSDNWKLVFSWSSWYSTGLDLASQYRECCLIPEFSQWARLRKGIRQFQKRLSYLGLPATDEKLAQLPRG